MKQSTRSGTQNDQQYFGDSSGLAALRMTSNIGYAAAVPALLFAVVLASSLSGCGNADAADLNGAKAKDEAESVRLVRVASATVGEVQETISRASTISAPNTVHVLPRISGQITSLEVVEGKVVDPGDLIAQLDDKELRLVEEKAKSVRDKAKRDFDLAEKKLNLSIISTEEYLEEKHRYEQAEKDHQAARIEREKAAIKSPIKGVISERHVSLGDTVFPATPIVTITDMRTLEAEVQIPQDQVSSLRVGNKVIISPGSDSKRVISGFVKRISPVIEARSGTTKVVIGIPSGQVGAKPGLFVKVLIVTGVKSGVTLVPRDAIVIEHAMSVLYKVVDGYARRIPVDVGFANGSSVQVTGDVNPGDSVVVVGSSGLADMTPVEVAPDSQ